MCKVAVIGYGVVGSGTVELFMKNRESISKKVGKAERGRFRHRQNSSRAS